MQVHPEHLKKDITGMVLKRVVRMMMKSAHLPYKGSFQFAGCKKRNRGQNITEADMISSDSESKDAC